MNAPIGNRAAFAYGEALNYMLRVKDYHSLLGSTTLVYWAETAQSAYSDCFAAMLGTNNDMTQNMLDGIMKAIRLGQDIQWKNVPAEFQRSLLHSWIDTEYVPLVGSFLPARDVRRFCREFGAVIRSA